MPRCPLQEKKKSVKELYFKSSEQMHLQVYNELEYFAKLQKYEHC